MGYIKSQSHFMNYLNKVLRTNQDLVDQDDLMNEDMYIHYIYKKKLQDRYCWALKENPSLLEEDHLLEWISSSDEDPDFSFNKPGVNQFTDEFYKIVDSLEGSGVYSFWNKSGKLLYIGMSIDLKNRIISSFSEKFKNYTKPLFLKYFKTKTMSDAAVLEVYLICLLKPVFNKVALHEDEVTFKINGSDIPDFSDPVLCNTTESI